MLSLVKVPIFLLSLLFQRHLSKQFYVIDRAFFVNQKLHKGAKLTYKFMMIIPLLAIELKAIPKGNPINNLIYGGSNLALSMKCNVISPVEYCPSPLKSLKNLKQPGYGLAVSIKINPKDSSRLKLRLFSKVIS